MILTIPSGVGVSSNAGSFVWDWPSVVRGEGFHQADVASFRMSCQITDNSGFQNEEETIVYRGVSQSYYKSNDFSMVSEYNNATSRSYSLPSGLNGVTARHVGPTTGRFGWFNRSTSEASGNV